MENYKNVLIVDDEYLVRQLLKMSLNFELYGFNVAAEASNAQEAMDIIKNQKIDVAFVDICMPVMNGIDLSRSIKEYDKNIEIVILTGHGDLESARESIHIGVSDFLLKPIKVAEVKQALSKLSSGKTCLSQIKSKLIKDVVNWVMENLDNPKLTLNLAAETFFVSHSYLSRKFKQETGETFKNYLTKLKIDKAKELIETTELLNYEIAERVGIDNPNYLSYCFKKTVNESITEYRKNIVKKVKKSEIMSTLLYSNSQ